jgi:hypothetical protein
MGLLDMLLDNSDKIGDVAAKVGLPPAQTKAALDKIVPVVRDKLGGGKKPEASEEQQTAEQISKETGVSVEDVKKLMHLALAEAYKDPRFVGMDMADGKLDGKIGKPIKK